MASRSAPAPRPTPRLYLATPVLESPERFAGDLAAALSAGDIAAVLMRLTPADDRTRINRIKMAAPTIQGADAALLVDGHRDLIARGGADGAHVTGLEALAAALPALKPDRIVGVGGLHTRHDAMIAGESGTDYVLFGEPDAHGQRPATETVAERINWWAELFEPPCVAYAATLADVHIFAAAGADFILLDDAVWTDPRGPAAAVRDAMAAIASAMATTAAKA